MHDKNSNTTLKKPVLVSEGKKRKKPMFSGFQNTWKCY